MGIDRGLQFGGETLFATKLFLLQVSTAMQIENKFPRRTPFTFTCTPFAAFARLRFSLFREHSSAPLIGGPHPLGGLNVVSKPGICRNARQTATVRQTADTYIRECANENEFLST